MTRKVPGYAVGLVVGAGALWVLLPLFGIVFQDFSGTAVLGTSGATGVQGYPPRAVSDLLWAGYLAGILGVALGLMTILIGLSAFKKGERWAWYAVLIIPAIGAVAAFNDERQFGGWWTFLWTGVPSLLGLLLATPAIFWRRRGPPAPDKPAQSQRPSY